MRQIGKHVYVDYSAGAFGDWLRYFIAEHDGFEKFEEYGREGVYINYVGHINFTTPHYPIRPLKQIPFTHIKTGDDLIEEFKKQAPNYDKYRQVWKSADAPKLIGQGHTLVGSDWTKIEDIDFQYYDIVRKNLDHLIIFVSLSPFSKYEKPYMMRYREDAKKKKTDLEKEHKKTWLYNYVNKEYPKHELNFELEINELFEYDEELYTKLTEFLNVKPLPNWKDYIDEFNDRIL
tara:strand:+ start:449 stop:1147 length:699 start_codon:yes stop_codon:yes gene_type:complete